MLIIGAGMSGLLAANMFRKQSPKIIESQTMLPNNHSALLRFRSDSVSNASGIPFKKVKVQKQINYLGEHHSAASIKMANEYCYKITGEYNNRSIWNMDTCYRYVAPGNFISLLSNGCDISCGIKANFQSITNKEYPIISTIPMHYLMKILGWQKIPEFKYKSIWTATCDITHAKTDIYQTTYYPNPDLPIYRISITGDKVIVEFIEPIKENYKYKNQTLTLNQYISHFLNNDFGIELPNTSCYEIHYQKYGKLIPIDEKTRKEFISWATHEHKVYSLGRWATHRQILMDDVVNDINVINRLIKSSNYDR